MAGQGLGTGGQLIADRGRGRGRGRGQMPPSRGRDYNPFDDDEVDELAGGEATGSGAGAGSAMLRASTTLNSINSLDSEATEADEIINNITEPSRAALKEWYKVHGHKIPRTRYKAWPENTPLPPPLKNLTPGQQRWLNREERIMSFLYHGRQFSGHVLFKLWGADVNIYDDLYVVTMNKICLNVNNWKSDLLRHMEAHVLEMLKMHPALLDCSPAEAAAWAFENFTEENFWDVWRYCFKLLDFEESTELGQHACKLLYANMFGATLEVAITIHDTPKAKPTELREKTQRFYDLLPCHKDFQDVTRDQFYEADMINNKKRADPDFDPDTILEEQFFSAGPVPKKSRVISPMYDVTSVEVEDDEDDDAEDDPADSSAAAAQRRKDKAALQRQKKAANTAARKAAVSTPSGSRGGYAGNLRGGGRDSDPSVFNSSPFESPTNLRQDRIISGVSNMQSDHAIEFAAGLRGLSRHPQPVFSLERYANTTTMDYDGDINPE